MSSIQIYAELQLYTSTPIYGTSLLEVPCLLPTNAKGKPTRRPRGLREREALETVSEKRKTGSGVGKRKHGH